MTIELRINAVEAVHLKRLIVSGAKCDLSIAASETDSSAKHHALTSFFIASELCEQLDQVCAGDVFGWDALPAFPELPGS
jgi:hypothetical protein